MADSHRGWLSPWAGYSSRLTHFALWWLRFALIYGITQQPSCSEPGTNISGSDWRTALIPPTLEFMHHLMWKGVAPLMTTEERREEEDQRKQGERKIGCMCSAALWPLTLKNWTRFHSAFIHVTQELSQEQQGTWKVPSLLFFTSSKVENDCNKQMFREQGRTFSHRNSEENVVLNGNVQWRIIITIYLIHPHTQTGLR